LEIMQKKKFSLLVQRFNSGGLRWKARLTGGKDYFGLTPDEALKNLEKEGK